MPKLPFLTTPKAETVVIGNEADGTLEILKLKDLSINERIFVNEAMKSIPDLRMEAVRLAKKIADEKGVNVLDAYNALFENNTTLLEKHLEALLDFQSANKLHSEQRRLALSTAILKRLVPDWSMEDTGNSAEIPPSLVDEVYAFALKEESGWQSPEPVELTEEDLGKQQTTLTGEKSSGESGDTGVVMPDLAQKALAASQPG